MLKTKRSSREHRFWFFVNVQNLNDTDRGDRGAAIIWRALVATTITWKIVGGPLSSANYPKLDNVQLFLGFAVLLGSLWFSAYYVNANKERWLRNILDSGDANDAI